MHFKRIELNGFKSFADPVTIEFTDGITCIVGPTGSGKSNISDAVLWVLGEQSPKTLRSDKLEEVIEDADVLYVTRIQRERFPDPAEYQKVAGTYRIDNRILREAKSDLIVMHPLPRVDEIAPEVDETQHAKYFEQAFNGIPMRMALLCAILGGEM